VLPIPQHGLLKALPSLVAICTPQGLVVKVTCMRHGWMPGLKNFLSVQRPTLSALNCLFVHHLAAQPESLGVIAWLLHCCSLAFCAETWLVQGLT
jgi:hypothetical protein